MFVLCFAAHFRRGIGAKQTVSFYFTGTIKYPLKSYRVFVTAVEPVGKNPPSMAIEIFRTFRGHGWVVVGDRFDLNHKYPVRFWGVFDGSRKIK